MDKCPECYNALDIIERAGKDYYKCEVCGYEGVKK